MYDQVVKCQRAGLCLSEHFLIIIIIIKGAEAATWIGRVEETKRQHRKKSSPVEPSRTKE